jgi:8-oxo-dGTP diphosphatase
MSQISYVVNVEGAIFRNNQYLMIIRGREEAHASGLLAFVGGTVDSLGQMNDVLENHLRREIMEEVGLTVGEITSHKHISLCLTSRHRLSM